MNVCCIVFLCDDYFCIQQKIPKEAPERVSSTLHTFIVYFVTTEHDNKNISVFISIPLWNSSCFQMSAIDNKCTYTKQYFLNNVKSLFFCSTCMF